MTTVPQASLAEELASLCRELGFAHTARPRADDRGDDHERHAYTARDGLAMLELTTLDGVLVALDFVFGLAADSMVTLQRNNALMNVMFGIVLPTWAAGNTWLLQTLRTINTAQGGTRATTHDDWRITLRWSPVSSLLIGRLEHDAKPNGI
jgi:hypothetical protein